MFRFDPYHEKNCHHQAVLVTQQTRKGIIICRTEYHMIKYGIITKLIIMIRLSLHIQLYHRPMPTLNMKPEFKYHGRCQK